MKTNEELYKEFEALDNDVDRWKWVIENKEFVTVKLDNDDTFVIFRDEEDLDWDEEGHIMDIMEYVGWSDGIFNLLRALGVAAEGV
jgi:hypothetical protein